MVATVDGRRAVMFSDGHVRAGILVAMGICGGPCVSCWRAAFSVIDSVVNMEYRGKC
jgi:hypothetical protein